MINKLKKIFAFSSSDRYIKYLREKGIIIGENCKFYSPYSIQFDLTRPSLIEIGNSVLITKGTSILTHGYDWAVLRELYKDTLGYAQPVKICDNVFIGQFVRIMPGVTIGKNSIIGTGSIVTKSTEPNSVYAGVPARKIKTIEEYYIERKSKQLQEAVIYAKSIYKNFKRQPVAEDFKEFFFLFLERDPKKFGKIPVYKQTKKAFKNFMKSEPLFDSFNDFLEYVDNDK